MLTNQMMNKGKTGLFGMIERSSNLRNSRMFAILSLLLFALSVLLRNRVPELGMISLFMWLSAGMLLVSLAELVIVQRKEGAGKHLKWILGISFVVSAAITTSTLGMVGSMIYLFPLLLSIQYCSMMYSLFISVISIMGAFIPLLITVYMSNYDLNVVRLAPGTVIEVTSTLEAALDTVPVNATATKINELLAVLLPGAALVIIAAVVTVIITGAIRKIVLEQYHQFQTTRE